MKIRRVEAEMRTDRRPDTTKLIVVFRISRTRLPRYEETVARVSQLFHRKARKYIELSINPLNDGEGVHGQSNTHFTEPRTKNQTVLHMLNTWYVRILTLMVQVDLWSGRTAHRSHIFAEFTRTYTKDSPNTRR
jgi:hypothetical protein